MRVPMQCYPTLIKKPWMDYNENKSIHFLQQMKLDKNCFHLHPHHLHPKTYRSSITNKDCRLRPYYRSRGLLFSLLYLFLLPWHGDFIIFPRNFGLSPTGPGPYGAIKGPFDVGDKFGGTMSLCCLG
ncbi:hypothetical protein CEXT_551791 [Caerostris extrusa]|uniref:Uncharacterized protein n=1 Tax=Caerostris extrusa TaxID=172846 RepID=A0AAV4RAA3_CAEEX|nr:hypothetical protein CEXT_551791 [Caerostris extrusa]